MAAGADKDFITVVSGLPRSGTSMMMRMLDAGGVAAFTDHDRRPDADNPYGYYEYEAIKQVDANSTWLAGAAGRAIKAIYLLLYKLPPAYRYRIVFMQRDLPEVIASQDMMLRRSGASTGSLDPQTLARHFDTQLRQVESWLREQRHMAVLYVRYADVVQDPVATAAKVAEFLGGGLDLDRMTEMVDPALYRQRVAPNR